MLNEFRLIGDVLHLVSIAYLLQLIFRRDTCNGISGKSQLLFVLLYICRYLDLWIDYISVYNTTFKILYIAGYSITVILIFVVYRKSYAKTDDTFLTEILLISSFILALWFTRQSTTLEILWTFSIFLESVAILPQLYMIYKKREVELALVYYLILLGLYRLLYIFNWIYRYQTEGHYDLIAASAGIVYVVLYILALVLFCIMKLKVVREETSNMLQRNIFYISSNDPMSEVLHDEKKVASEKLLVEKI